MGETPLKRPLYNWENNGYLDQTPLERHHTAEIHFGTPPRIPFPRQLRRSHRTGRRRYWWDDSSFKREGKGEREKGTRKGSVLIGLNKIELLVFSFLPPFKNPRPSQMLVPRSVFGIGVNDQRPGFVLTWNRLTAKRPHTRIRSHLEPINR